MLHTISMHLHRNPTARDNDRKPQHSAYNRTLE